MAALRPSVDIRHDFFQYLQRPDIRRRNYEQKTFYFPDDIKKWMFAKTHEGGESNAINLLSDIYSDTDLYSKNKFIPISSDDIEHCYLLFAILVQMECGHMVHIFRKHITSPTFLGTTYPSSIIADVVRALENEKSNLSRKYAKGRYRAVVEEFDRLRWAFSPALNVLEMTDANIEERSILPFFHSSVINTKGGTANVHHHKIQADLVQSRKLREALEPSKKTDPQFGTYYEFAVKSYNKGWYDIYMMETEAFRGFNGTKNPKSLGVVRCLGQYARHFREGTGPLTQETYHIMLEFGEYDLDEYLAETHQPVLNAEIIALWKSIFRIAGAVRKIHQLEHAGINGRVKKYTGWHGDIKPDNILRVRGEFKLADFGFTKFEKNETGGSTSAVLLGGTRTFGAPERDNPSPGDSQPRFLPTIDTWSFGCVLSAVATWVVLGSQAYDNYGWRRKMAHEEICERQKHDANISVSSCQDAFHDGIKVLPAVLEWHEYLRNSTRRGDTITCRVLDLIDKGMLIQDPNERLTSANLCKELDRIVEEAAVEYSNALKSGTLKQESEQTLKALLQLDQNAPANAGPKSRSSSEEVLSNNSVAVLGDRISLNPQRPSLTISTNSRVRKSERLDKILHGKHANREEVITQSVANTRPPPIFESPNNESSLSQGQLSGNREFLSMDRSDFSEPISVNVDLGDSQGPTSMKTLKQTTGANHESHDNPAPNIRYQHSLSNNISNGPHWLEETHSITAPEPLSQGQPTPNASGSWSSELNREDSNHQPWPVPLLQTSRVETPLRTTGNNARNHDSTSPVSLSSGPRNTASRYNHLSPATPIRTGSTSLRNEPAAVIDEFYRLDKLWDDSRDTWSILTGKIPQDGYVEQFISNRDIKLVVDNAASMKAHWQNVNASSFPTSKVLFCDRSPLSPNCILCHSFHHRDPVMDRGRTNTCHFDDSVFEADGPSPSGARSSRDLPWTAMARAQMTSTEMEPSPYISFRGKRQEGKNRFFEGDQNLAFVERSILHLLFSSRHPDSAVENHQSTLKHMAFSLAAFLCFSTTLAFPFTGVSFAFALVTGDGQGFTSSLLVFAAKWAVHYLILVVVGIMTELGLLVVRLHMERGESIDGCEEGLVVKLYMRAALIVCGRTGSPAAGSTTQ